jgi:hypothetical protein
VAAFLHCTSQLALKLGSPEGSPSQIPKRRMNSALKKFVINHWLKPVAWTEKS